jgi:hypothetical protein
LIALWPSNTVEPSTVVGGKPRTLNYPGSSDRDFFGGIASGYPSMPRIISGYQGTEESIDSVAHVVDLLAVVDARYLVK